MRHRVAFVLLGALILGLSAGAQETTGDIIGRVTSEDGQPLPGASVGISHEDSGFSRSVVAGSDGTYRFAGLRPAIYEMTARLSGFKSYQRTVRISLGHTLTNNIQMSSEHSVT